MTALLEIEMTENCKCLRIKLLSAIDIDFEIGFFDQSLFHLEARVQPHEKDT